MVKNVSSEESAWHQDWQGTEFPGGLLDRSSFELLSISKEVYLRVLALNLIHVRCRFSLHDLVAHNIITFVVSDLNMTKFNMKIPKE